ncbi:MAG: hypothetical protein EOO41_04770, partial [Methanobacteriota archaeon]
MQPPSQAPLLELLSHVDDDTFIRRVQNVFHWQSDLLADLRHYATVNARIARILHETLQLHPYLLIDGRPVPEHNELDAASARVLALVRFWSLLIRSCSNKRHFQHHALLTALLAARVQDVADAALIAVACVVERATSYMLRSADSVPRHVLTDTALRERLVILAESCAGTANNVARSSAMQSLWDGALLTRLKSTHNVSIRGARGGDAAAPAEDANHSSLALPQHDTSGMEVDAPASPPAAVLRPPVYAPGGAAPDSLATLSLLQLVVADPASLPSMGASVVLDFDEQRAHTDDAAPVGAASAALLAALRAAVRAHVLVSSTSAAHGSLGGVTTLFLPDVAAVVRHAAHQLGAPGAVYVPPWLLTDAVAAELSVPLEAKFTLHARIVRA